MPSAHPTVKNRGDQKGSGKLSRLDVFVEEAADARIIIRRDMSAAVEPVLVDDQALEPDRAPRVGLVGADADLGSKAEAKPIGEAGRGVVKNSG